MLQLLHAVYKLSWLSLRYPPKSVAKFSTSLHMHCCYTGTKTGTCTVHVDPEYSGGTPRFKNELATTYQHSLVKSLQQQGDETSG